MGVKVSLGEKEGALDRAQAKADQKTYRPTVAMNRESWTSFSTSRGVDVPEAGTRGNGSMRDWRTPESPAREGSEGYPSQRPAASLRQLHNDRDAPERTATPMVPHPRTCMVRDMAV